MGDQKIQEWCDKRKLKVDFNCVTPVELNELLRKFYTEVKSKNGQPLTPSTLTGIRAVIHRQLTSAPISRSMNIMQDSEFLSANKMFETKCKLYTKEMNPKPTHKSSIAAGDMLKLRGYFSEGTILLKLAFLISFGLFFFDNNDNDLTFFGNIVYLRPCSVICRRK